MGTTSGLHINLATAIRTNLGGGRNGYFFLAAAKTFKLMESFDNQKHDESHNKEINNGGGKSTVSNGRAVNMDGIIVKIGASNKPNDGGKDIFSQ